MKCNDCGADEGTLLKEFDSEKSYYWSELSEMTEVCASCGSENIDVEDPADRDDKHYHEEQDHIAMEKAKETK